MLRTTARRTITYPEAKNEQAHGVTGSPCASPQHRPRCGCQKAPLGPGQKLESWRPEDDACWSGSRRQAKILVLLLHSRGLLHEWTCRIDREMERSTGQTFPIHTHAQSHRRKRAVLRVMVREQTRWEYRRGVRPSSAVCYSSHRLGDFTGSSGPLSCSIVARLSGTLLKRGLLSCLPQTRESVTKASQELKRVGTELRMVSPRSEGSGCPGKCGK
jgi:hypothetical protein